MLGAIYDLGGGVPQDYENAYKWFNLAAATGHSDFIKMRDDLAKKMTPQQIASGQDLTKRFIRGDSEAAW